MQRYKNKGAGAKCSMFIWDNKLILKRIVHELKIFRFLKIPSYKSNLL